MSNRQLSRELAGALEARFNVAHAIPVSRAALGLVAVLRCWRQAHAACGVAVGGAVCHEVVLAVLAAGCEPVFCDVEPLDGLVPEAEWVKARSRGAKVALMVHLYGNPARAAPVRAVFCAPDCLVIDDAAQALGSDGEDGAAGTLGDVGLLSFGPTKQISTGNAALLVRDGAWARRIEQSLEQSVAQPQAVRDTLNAEFRRRLEMARARLRTSGDAAASEFAGLLEGLQPVVDVPYSAACEAATLQALEGYAAAAGARVEKRELWLRELAGTGLRPVGMGQGCVPWRYACRLPGLSWSEQHRISTELRACGMHVSNWYLPAHWFVGQPAGTLPGVEQLAREVFQFWLDDATTTEAIVRDSAIVRQQMAGLHPGMPAGSAAREPSAHEG